MIAKYILGILLVGLLLPTPVRAEEEESSSEKENSEEVQKGLAFIYGNRRESDEAIDGFSATKFESTEMYGIKLMMKGPPEKKKPAQLFRMELEATRVSTVLAEGREEFGTLNQTLLLANFRYGTYMTKKRGVGVGITLGLGVSLSTFDNGPFINDLIDESGVGLEVDPGLGFGLGLGLMLEVNLTKRLVADVDFRFAGSSFGSKWRLENGETIDEFEDMSSAGGQLYGSLGYWFGE